MLQLNAQNETDALRYSLFEYGGTARSIGAGSALGALGADFSVMNTNPAGLGWYRKSIFSLTPAIAGASISSTLANDSNGPISDESNSKFHMASVGIVVASKPPGSQWRAFNFGMGFNRIADFNQEFYYEGASKGSIVDRFQELANSEFGFDEFESGLAFDAEALYDFNNDGFYDSDLELAPDALISRNQTVRSSGSINELVLAFAGNYKEKLLLGMSVGVPFVNFNEEKTYQESDPDDMVPAFDDLEYIEDLTTTGVGINLKLGLLVRVNQMIRLGAAVHTPTAYNLNDNYTSEMTYNYTDNNVAYQGSATSPDGSFEYKLRTPWRVFGNAGVIFGKSGFLSGEIEYVNYQNAELRFTDFRDSEREANQLIAKNLKSAINVKVGGELVYDIFRFRAGLGMQQSALTGDDTFNPNFSLGLGIREQSLFVDFAYRFSSVKETYVPYRTSEAPMQFVDNDINKSYIAVTLGFKF
ncbi:MAG: hemin receptor [Saprospiraceae bacterium]|nr:MAG: hemin receptor [Saprospiraceae bacterium]